MTWYPHRDQAGSIGTADIATDAVTAAKIAAGAVGSSEDPTAQRIGDAITDWVEWVPLNAIDVITSGTVALTRNAQGDYSLNQTAGGAETSRFSAVAPRLRTTSGKGVKILGLVVAYEIAVADATSVDLLVDQVSYVAATNPVVAAHGGTIVDGDYDAANDTALERADKDVTGGEHVLTLTLNTPIYNVTAGRQVRGEASFVLALNGTLKVRAFGFKYAEIEA